MTTVFLLANCEGKGVTYHRFGFFFFVLSWITQVLLFRRNKQTNKQQTEMRNNRKLSVCLFR